MKSLFQITAECNFIAEARRLDMRAATFWKVVIVPFLSNDASSPYVVRTLKHRALWEIKDLIPRGVEFSMFNAFLRDPATKAHTARDLRTEYGVSREYIAVRLLGYLERHMQAGSPMPHPLGTYLANLIPNRIADTSIQKLLESGEFDCTLKGFSRKADTYSIQRTNLQLERDAKRRKDRANSPKRWDEPITAYLRRVEDRRALRTANDTNWLNANPPSLKEFAKHLQSALPAPCSKKRPTPIGIMQYIHQRLRSQIASDTYNTLWQQAAAFSAGQHPDCLARLDSLK